MFLLLSSFLASFFFASSLAVVVVCISACIMFIFYFRARRLNHAWRPETPTQEHLQRAREVSPMFLFVLWCLFGALASSRWLSDLQTLQRLPTRSFISLNIPNMDANDMPACAVCLEDFKDGKCAPSVSVLPILLEINFIF